MAEDKEKPGFLKSHWDWLVAGAGVLVFAYAATSFVASLGTSPDEAAGEFEAQLRQVTPRNRGVPPLRDAFFHDVLRGMRNPPQLKPVDPKKANFLASERRVLCTAGDPKEAKKACGKPIPPGLSDCPFCGMKQVVAEKVDVDSDRDGLPNEWEKKHGLNPADPSDATADRDGDGFSNLEEYEAKTDPLDAKSHPDYLDFFAVEGEMKQTILPFYFKTATPIPGGHRITFQKLKSTDVYSKAYTPKIGEEIGKTGFVVTKYDEKSEDRVIAGSKTKATKKVDVSTVTIERKADGKKMELLVNVRKNPVDTLATLVYRRPGGKTYTVSVGHEIELFKAKFKVTAIRTRDGKCEVDVFEPAEKRTKTIKVLE